MLRLAGYPMIAVTKLSVYLAENIGKYLLQKQFSARLMAMICSEAFQIAGKNTSFDSVHH